jgi:thiol-disulfide isomerase/thioredoxin
MNRSRLAAVLGLAAAVGAGVSGVRALSRRRLAHLKEAPSAELWRALGTEPDGRPTVVAFSTPGCAACRTAQAPALAALERQLGPSAVRIVPIDAAAQPAAADAFGVLTVPTTVVLTADGAVAAVNNGFAPTARLAEQLIAGTR